MSEALFSNSPYRRMEELSKEALADPQPGDHWQEMYSWHCFVVHRIGEVVYTLSGSPPVTFPDQGKPEIRTIEEFRAWLSYQSVPGTWALCCKRGASVTGWFDSRFEIRPKEGR